VILSKSKKYTSVQYILAKAAGRPVHGTVVGKMSTIVDLSNSCIYTRPRHSTFLSGRRLHLPSLVVRTFLAADFTYQRSVVRPFHCASVEIPLLPS